MSDATAAATATTTLAQQAATLTAGEGVLNEIQSLRLAANDPNNPDHAFALGLLAQLEQTISGAKAAKEAPAPVVIAGAEQGTAGVVATAPLTQVPDATNAVVVAAGAGSETTPDGNTTSVAGGLAANVVTPQRGNGVYVAPRPTGPIGIGSKA